MVDVIIETVLEFVGEVIGFFLDRAWNKTLDRVRASRKKKIERKYIRLDRE